MMHQPLLLLEHAGAGRGQHTAGNDFSNLALCMSPYHGDDAARSHGDLSPLRNDSRPPHCPSTGAALSRTSAVPGAKLTRGAFKSFSSGANVWANSASG